MLKCYEQFVIIINYKVPQGMFKNVPHFKTKCGIKNANEAFAERRQYRDYLILFFINNYEQAS